MAHFSSHSNKLSWFCTVNVICYGKINLFLFFCKVDRKWGYLYLWQHHHRFLLYFQLSVQLMERFWYLTGNDIRLYCFLYENKNFVDFTNEFLWILEFSGIFWNFLNLKKSTKAIFRKYKKLFFANLVQKSLLCSNLSHKFQSILFIFRSWTKTSTFA